MPKKRTEECWKLRDGPGYIENRRGRARLRYNGVSRALGMAFIPANRKAALAVLQELVDRDRAIMLSSRFGIALATPIDVRKIPTNFEAAAEFKRATFQDIGYGARLMYERAFSYFFQKEFEISADTTFAVLVERNTARSVDGSPALADNTRIKYLQYLRSFFEWIVERGYLTRNPVDALGWPKRNEAPGGERYQTEEVDRLVKELAGGVSPYPALAVRFLSMTGFRIGELLALKREHARGKYLPANSKGTSRELPIEIVPGLRKLLDEILALPDEGEAHARGKLFPWNNPTTLRTTVNAALDKLEIPRKGTVEGCTRTLHNFRDTALWWWEHDLLWIDQDRYDAAGHTGKVATKYYRIQPTGPELELRIRARSTVHRGAQAGAEKLTEQRTINGHSVDNRSRKTR